MAEEFETITIVTTETAQSKSLTRGGVGEAAVRQTVEKSLSVEALSASFNSFINDSSEKRSESQKS